VTETLPLLVLSPLLRSRRPPSGGQINCCSQSENAFHKRSGLRFLLGENLMQTTKEKTLGTCRRLAASICLIIPFTFAAHGAGLAPGEPLLLEGTQGKFDFLRVDAARHRLLLAHTGNKSLDVFDLDSKKLLKSISTGAAQDSSVDETNGRYYVSVSAPPRMAIIDSKKLEMIGEVPIPQAADLLMFNPANGRVYVCNDETPEIWVIDPKSKRIVYTIKCPGTGSVMEDLAFDENYQKLFQVIKGGNMLVVIDPEKNSVSEPWITAPATNPHGMALIPDTDRLLVAGGAGKLALMSRSSGKVLASADIAPKVDQMAYDAQLHTAYCASGLGKISIVSIDGDQMTAVGEVPSEPGCHSIVLDPKTRTLWIAYGKGDQAFAQPFTVTR
jgi:sugar lactone lactonase YvrE